jgi:hypothetical protein
MKLKKGDMFLVAILSLFVLSILAFNLFFQKNGQTVEISVDGKIVAVKNINKDEQIKLEHNIITIKNGKVAMEESNCPDQLCVKHTPLKKSGEIICLPNRVIVKIISNKDSKSKVDVVVGQ